MNVNDVQQILNDLFNAELTNDRNRHIVFWYDESREFVDEINHIQLENVRIWKFSENNLFETKYELEVIDQESHVLLYTNMPKPAPREDWLLNLYKLGSEFTADRITIFMRKLGLKDDRLRHVFLEYGQFFRSKARFEAFQKYPIDNLTEESIHLNVLSALTRSRVNTIDEIVRSLFLHLNNDRYDAWNAVQKYGNEEIFWKIVQEHYGYTLEKSLQSLLTFFMMTYITEQNVDINYPKTWLAYVSSRPTNAIVFMDQWMNHRIDCEIYNKLSERVSEFMKVELYIREWNIDELSSFDAFRIFDERIIEYIVDQLTNDVGLYNEYESLILNRRNTHWYTDFQYEYDALLEAILFFRKMDQLDQHIPEESAEQLFQSYIDTYYTFDAAYRKFHVAYNQLNLKDLFRPLRERFENSYTNWYIHELSMKWTSSLQNSEEKWFIQNLQKQNDFYKDWVQPILDRNQRVYVIISDALRFDIAKELMVKLNNERKASVQLQALQGVIPSYTSLGMASLLPHENIIIRNGDIFVDGIRATGTRNREKIIRNYIAESSAYTYQEITQMDRRAIRKAFSGMKVVYIYHNAIDAVGDNTATEKNVFMAAENAMNEINDLMNRLVNSVSASNILITADHGFIYQQNQVDVSQMIPQNKGNHILTSRRFIISESKSNIEGTLTYEMNEILSGDKPQYVTLPKGIDRFQIQGSGANFVHGGAMLQEIVIPVISFKNDRTKSSINVVRTVDVKLTNLSRKITSEEVVLEFFQVSAVDDKVLPRSLRAYFVDEHGVEISNECRIIADLQANEAFERLWKEQFLLKSIPYDRTKTYYLILEDCDGNLYDKYAFTIDIVSPL